MRQSVVLGRRPCLLERHAQDASWFRAQCPYSPAGQSEITSWSNWTHWAWVRLIYMPVRTRSRKTGDWSNGFVRRRIANCKRKLVNMWEQQAQSNGRCKIVHRRLLKDGCSAWLCILSVDTLSVNDVTSAPYPCTNARALSPWSIGGSSSAGQKIFDLSLVHVLCELPLRSRSDWLKVKISVELTRSLKQDRKRGKKVLEVQ